MNDRRLCNSPVFSAIRRNETLARPDRRCRTRHHSCRTSQCRCRWRRMRLHWAALPAFFHHHRIPGHAVRGRNQRELAVHRIAHGDSVCAVPEGKAIVKSFGIAVGELPLPDLAAVRGFINTRLIARANAEHERGVLVKGLNVAKIESVGARNDQCLPVLCRRPWSAKPSPWRRWPKPLAGNGTDAAKLGRLFCCFAAFARKPWKKLELDKSGGNPHFHAPKGLRIVTFGIQLTLFRQGGNPR